MNKKEFTKAGLLYMIANLFNKGIAFLTVPIFSRILSTTDYGILTTFNSFVSTLSVIISLSLYMGIRASFIDYKEKETENFLSTVVTFTLIIFIIVMSIIGIGASVFSGATDWKLVIFCFVQSFGIAMLDDFCYFLMMRYQYKMRTALMVLPSFISAILSIVTILFVVKEKLYLGRIVPTTIVYGIFALLILGMVYSKARPQINREYLKYGLAISLPLVMHSIALHVLSQSDRIMITWLRDAAETGIYSLVYNLSMIATVITSSLDGIWVPWFTGKLKNKEIKDVNERAMDYVNLMTYVLVSLVLVGPEILKIFADKRYWEGISIIPPIVLANYLIFMYTLYVNVEHFYKKTRVIFVNTVLCAVVNIILNYLFIPYFGYVAAAFTTLVSYLLAFILHSYCAKKIEKNLYPLKMFVRSLIHIGIVILIYYLTINVWYIRWALMIVYLICMLYRERYRIGYLVPAIGDKFSFFKEKK